MLPRILASCVRVGIASRVPKPIRLSGFLTGATPAAPTTVSSRELSLTSWCLANKYGSRRGNNNNNDDDGRSSSSSSSSSGSSTNSRGQTKGRGRSKRNKIKDRRGKRSGNLSSGKSRGHSRVDGPAASNVKSGSDGPIQSGIKWAKSVMDEMSGDHSAQAERVRQDKSKNQFVLDLGEGKMARVDYKSIGRNKIEMYHTEVPSEVRGRGIGRALAKGALERAASNNYKVKLTCSYLIDYLNKYADENLKKNVEIL